LNDLGCCIPQGRKCASAHGSQSDSDEPDSCIQQELKCQSEEFKAGERGHTGQRLQIDKSHTPRVVHICSGVDCTTLLGNNQDAYITRLRILHFANSNRSRALRNCDTIILKHLVTHCHLLGTTVYVI